MCIFVWQYLLITDGGKFLFWVLTWICFPHYWPFVRGIHLSHGTGPLWGESNCPQWISLQKSNNVELWCSLWCLLAQMFEQTMDLPVIWDVITVILHHHNQSYIYNGDSMGIVFIDLLHIEVSTKWLPFWRQHFLLHFFLNWYFYLNSTEDCCKDFSWQCQHWFR